MFIPLPLQPSLLLLTVITNIATHTHSYTSSFLVAVAMIGPFISAVALILIIPIGFVTDYIMGNWRPAEESTAVLSYQIVGCALIVVGFALLQWASKVRC